MQIKSLVDISDLLFDAAGRVSTDNRSAVTGESQFFQMFSELSETSGIGEDSENQKTGTISSTAPTIEPANSAESKYFFSAGFFPSLPGEHPKTAINSSNSIDSSIPSLPLSASPQGDFDIEKHVDVQQVRTAFGEKHLTDVVVDSLLTTSAEAVVSTASEPSADLSLHIPEITSLPLTLDYTVRERGDSPSVKSDSSEHSGKNTLSLVSIFPAGNEGNIVTVPESTVEGKLAGSVLTEPSTGTVAGSPIIIAADNLVSVDQTTQLFSVNRPVTVETVLPLIADLQTKMIKSDPAIVTNAPELIEDLIITVEGIVYTGNIEKTGIVSGQIEEGDPQDTVVTKNQVELSVVKSSCNVLNNSATVSPVVQRAGSSTTLTSDLSAGRQSQSLSVEDNVLADKATRSVPVVESVEAVQQQGVVFLRSLSGTSPLKSSGNASIEPLLSTDPVPEQFFRQHHAAKTVLSSAIDSATSQLLNGSTIESVLPVSGEQRPSVEGTVQTDTAVRSVPTSEHVETGQQQGGAASKSLADSSSVKESHNISVEPVSSTEPVNAQFSRHSDPVKTVLSSTIDSAVLQPLNRPTVQSSPPVSGEQRPYVEGTVQTENIITQSVPVIDQIGAEHQMKSTKKSSADTRINPTTSRIVSEPIEIVNLPGYREYQTFSALSSNNLGSKEGIMPVTDNFTPVQQASSVVADKLVWVPSAESPLFAPVEQTGRLTTATFDSTMSVSDNMKSRYGVDQIIVKEQSAFSQQPVKPIISNETGISNSCQSGLAGGGIGAELAGKERKEQHSRESFIDRQYSDAEVLPVKRVVGQQPGLTANSEQSGSSQKNNLIATAGNNFHSVKFKEQFGGSNTSTSNKSSFTELGQLAETSSSLNMNQNIAGLQAAWKSRSMEQRIVDLVVDRLNFNHRPAAGNITLRLNSDELGQLRMGVEFKGNKISVQLQSQNKLMHDILNNHVPKLKETLEQQGFTVDEIVIGSPGEQRDNGSFLEQHAQESSAGATQRRVNSHSAEQDDNDTPLVMSRKTHTSRGGLSLFI